VGVDGQLADAGDELADREVLARDSEQDQSARLEDLEHLLQSAGEEPSRDRVSQVRRAGGDDLSGRDAEKAETVAGRRGPTDCRDNAQAATLPEATAPAVAIDVIELLRQWPIAVEREVEGGDDAVP